MVHGYIYKDRDFDYAAKTLSIFWAQRQRQWKETARAKESCKEYDVRASTSSETYFIHERGDTTKSTWKGISRQLEPIGRINRRTF